MSSTPLDFNNNGQPVPSQNNTITLREFYGNPIAQIDVEQNFVNLKGRINDLLNSVSVIGTDSTNTGQTIWQNLASIDAKASLIDTTLSEKINQINTQLSGSGDIDATTLDVSGAVTTGELTVDKTLKIKSGNSEATFIANDDYEALTIKPRSGSDQGSIFLQKSDLEVGGDAQIEGDLIVQGKVQGNLDIQGNITVSGEVNSDRAGWNFITPVEVVPHYFGGTSTQRHKVFGVGEVPANASKALLQWQTHQGYVQIRNPNGHGHVTVGSIGDNQDGSAVFVVENIQLPLNQNVGPSTSSLSVPTSKAHSNMIPEGHIEFVLGDANHDGPSRHLFIKVIAYMI
jgi:cytoskeletal protein CcmA (bactofilin family)